LKKRSLLLSGVDTLNIFTSKKSFQFDGCEDILTGRSKWGGEKLCRYTYCLRILRLNAASMMDRYWYNTRSKRHCDASIFFGMHVAFNFVWSDRTFNFVRPIPKL
jgi:hypothetical protein